jgi:hypothetical protein
MVRNLSDQPASQIAKWGVFEPWTALDRKSLTCPKLGGYGPNGGEWLGAHLSPTGELLSTNQRSNFEETYGHLDGGGIGRHGRVLGVARFG